MILSEYQNRYEDILNSNFTEKTKDEKLAILMTELEKEFCIPILKNPEWERENRKVLALYRKISMTRSFILNDIEHFKEYVG
ncbi:hypothetical protein ACH95_22655 [Bacillus glycinifermentans]|uniref:Uncharacterized protein n=2 Tax=Bacillus sonorensis TaxID=119858 RepID=M5NYI9_9BACI|nr:MULTISPECIES: hypothetical protein [Bacillus]ASB89344.1 hypothetical protein S101395_02837 [Bacillus sonorensis]EME72299.1 hypothetical protein BSONL12_23415 [Bacillus sonorensis L12]KMM52247.1 hypothetical protein ACH95_22655 [Bacillus glycinifermentans]MCZ0075375.1 hypothetical protein [Bacillus sonorensis]MCZ0093030.1 hypothetical protein [Bacillus sonorensis]